MGEREDDLAYLVGMARAAATVLREFEDDLRAISKEKAQLARHMRIALANAAKKVTRHAPAPAVPRQTGAWTVPPPKPKPPDKK